MHWSVCLRKNVVHSFYSFKLDLIYLYIFNREVWCAFQIKYNRTYRRTGEKKIEMIFFWYMLFHIFCFWNPIRLDFPCFVRHLDVNVTQLIKVTSLILYWFLSSLSSLNDLCFQADLHQIICVLFLPHSCVNGSLMIVMFDIEEIFLHCQSLLCSVMFAILMNDFLERIFRVVFSL